jgi:hypothetical protein
MLGKNKGKIRTEETKMKISLALKGKESPLKGKKRSQSFCEKTSLGRLGKKRGPYKKQIINTC